MVATLCLFVACACGEPAPEVAAHDADAAVADRDPASDRSPHDDPARADARRIVSLVPAATELLVALGAGDRLVGRAADDPTPGVEAVPAVGHVLAPALERVAVLAPDLILVPPEMRPATRSSLGSLSPGVMIEVVTVHRLADVLPTVARLGALVSANAAARSLADSLAAGLATVSDVVADAAEGRAAPSALWVVSDRPPVAAGPGTYLHDLLVLAGGRNVLADAPDPWPTPSPEVLALQTPDVVLWSARGPPDLDGPWRVVAGALVHRLDPDLFLQPGARVVEAARRLAVLLHPHMPPTALLPRQRPQRPAL
jgi:iron complex transport system substrate-binding protein